LAHLAQVVVPGAIDRDAKRITPVISNSFSATIVSWIP
jgi:hypothetical protein